MPTRNLLVPKQFYLLAVLLWSGVIAFFCLAQFESVPLGTVSNIDKVVHVFFHFVLTVLCSLFFYKYIHSFYNWKSELLAFLFSLFFGIGIEIIQNLYTATRHGDLLDVLANVFGSILGIAIVYVLNLKSRFK